MSADESAVERLRTVADLALVAGAVGSLALMYWAGRRNPSLVLMAMFFVWVASPFAGLAIADRRSMRWPVRLRIALYRLTLALALGSLVVYGVNAVRPLAARGAFVFLVTPVATWLIGAAALAVGARREWRD